MNEPEEHDRPFQFRLVDTFMWVALAAAAMGLWQFQRQVNPASVGQHGQATWMIVNTLRIVWNLVFVSNLMLIFRTRLMAYDTRDARVQFWRLTMLSLPWLTFYATILIGMAIGPESFARLTMLFGLLLYPTAFCCLLLFFMLSMEAQSKYHRSLQLVALCGSTITLILSCGLSWIVGLP